jgi:hypothetical protein
MIITANVKNTVKKNPMLYYSWDFACYGAGDGNRTHVTSLGSWHSAIELHPQMRSIITQASRFAYKKLKI